MLTSTITTVGKTWRTMLASTIFALIICPFVLSMIHIPTPWGIRIHCFQLALIWGAYLCGPFGGILAGAAGSFAGALMMANPYIIIGNMILGAAIGYFAERGIRPLFAIWFAFLIQLPWLVISDYFFMSLSTQFIKNLILSLFLSNTLWALVAGFALTKRGYMGHEK
jgi:hypothetical protein